MINKLLVGIFTAVAFNSVQAAVIVKPLEKLNAPHPIKLSTSESGYVVKLPYSPREHINSVSLHLEFVNSTALIKSRSALSVRANGEVLDQYTLDPANFKQVHDINIPVSLLKPGYNDIFIRVDQHYTYDCEDPASPELWTEIDSRKSTLTVDVDSSILNDRPSLAQLPIIFDKKAWIPRPVTFVFGTPSYDQKEVAAAGLVAQGIALRYDVVTPNVNVASYAEATREGGSSSVITGISAEEFKHSDGVVIGTKSSLNSLVSPSLIEQIKGPFVGVYPVNGGDSMVLVVSGTSPEELKEAATAIANPLFRFPAVSQALVSNSDILPPAVAIPADAIRFSAFNWRSQSSKGFKASPIYFEFRAPSDYAASKGDQSILDLHFAYGAGLRKDSSIAAYLNGNFVTSVQLSDERGAEIRGYELRVPSEYIRPGLNSISFVPVFIGKKAECDMVRDEGFVTTIYDDSTLQLSSPSKKPSAPDLFRFSKGLWTQDVTFRTYLVSNSSKSIEAYLSIMGLVSQKNKYPLDTEVSYGDFSTGPMVIIGDDKNVNPEIFEQFSISKFNWNSENDNVGIAQTVSKSKNVMTAFFGDVSAIKAAVPLMQEKGLWNSIEGQDAIIDVSQENITTSPVINTVDTVSASKLSAILSWVSQNWKISLVLLGLAILIVAAVVSRGLNNREDQR